MIIGVGMFAIPFSFVQSGFLPGAIELIVLSCAVTMLHLLYGEIVLATPEFHRMPGYIRAYLGRGATKISWASTLFGTIGTLLAYLVVGSLFVQTVFGPVGAGTHINIFAIGLVCIVGLITFFPLKKESAINSVLTVFEIAFIALLSLLLLPNISLPNFSAMRARDLFAPYGVLLFALSGAGVIPDVVTVLGRNKKMVRIAIITGSLIPAALYLLFAFAVVGVSGVGTSTEAIVGLQRTFGNNIALWASAVGFLAVLTSFVALSANFQALLSLDLAMPRRFAWLAASAIPFVLYLAGFQNFIAIISIVGVVAFGVDAILFLLMGRSVRRMQGQKSTLASITGFAILAVLLVGVFAELLRFLNGKV